MYFLVKAQIPCVYFEKRKRIEKGVGMGRARKIAAGLAALLLLVCVGCVPQAQTGMPYIWLLAPEYESVFIGEGSGLPIGFTDGLLPVKVLREGETTPRLGYIDESGSFAISPQFLQAHSFSNGLAAVSPDDSGLFGFIDLSGRFVIPVIFGGAGAFGREGLAPVCDADSGRWGFIDWTGEWVIGPVYTMAGEFHDGAALVGLEEDQGEVYNYINTEGGLLSGESFLMAYDFNEGLARVWVGDDYKTARAGFLAPDGSLAIEPRFFDVGNFSDGLAYAAEEEGGLYGYIDSTGEYVIPPRFVFGSDFCGGMAEAGIYTDETQSETMGGYIDAEGEWVIAPQFYLTQPFRGGYATVMTLDAFKSGSGTHTVIDRKGTLMLTLNRELSDGVTVSGRLHENLAVARKDGLFGILMLPEV